MILMITLAYMWCRNFKCYRVLPSLSWNTRETRAKFILKHCSKNVRKSNPSFLRKNPANSLKIHALNNGNVNRFSRYWKIDEKSSFDGFHADSFQFWTRLLIRPQSCQTVKITSADKSQLQDFQSWKSKQNFHYNSNFVSCKFVECSP